MDLNGMNSSVTPLSKPAQDARPFKSLNTDAARVLDMLKGSYLFDDDPKRIIQDPESMRASSIRQGSAWKAWAALRDTVAIQINSSDNNPAIRVGLAPQDSRNSRPRTSCGTTSRAAGTVMASTATSCRMPIGPYPMANDVEAFTTALANLDVAVMLRIERFTSVFFTVIKPSDVLTTEEQLRAAGPAGYGFGGYTRLTSFRTSKALLPRLHRGSGIVATVEDLQAQTRIKVAMREAWSKTRSCFSAMIADGLVLAEYQAATGCQTELRDGANRRLARIPESGAVSGRPGHHPEQPAGTIVSRSSSPIPPACSTLGDRSVLTAWTTQLYRRRPLGSNRTSRSAANVGDQSVLSNPVAQNQSTAIAPFSAPAAARIARHIHRRMLENRLGRAHLNHRPSFITATSEPMRTASSRS